MYTLLPATGISGVFYLGLGILAALLGTVSLLAGRVSSAIQRRKDNMKG